MSTTKCTYVFSIIFLPIYEYYRIGPYANTNLDIENSPHVKFWIDEAFIYRSVLLMDIKYSILNTEKNFTALKSRSIESSFL